MKNVLKQTFLAILVLLCVFLLGITPCMIISIFIAIVSEATLSDCIQTVPFILFSVLGIIVSACYINEEVLNK